MTDSCPLLDIEIDEEYGLACLTIRSSEHGWSQELLVENSREYRGEGVESVSASSRCFVDDPDDLRQLSEYIDEKVNQLERAQNQGGEPQ